MIEVLIFREDRRGLCIEEEDLDWRCEDDDVEDADEVEKVIITMTTTYLYITFVTIVKGDKEGATDRCQGLRAV